MVSFVYGHLDGFQIMFFKKCFITHMIAVNVLEYFWRIYVKISQGVNLLGIRHVHSNLSSGQQRAVFNGWTNLYLIQKVIRENYFFQVPSCLTLQMSISIATTTQLMLFDLEPYYKIVQGELAFLQFCIFLSQHNGYLSIYLILHLCSESFKVFSISC